MKTTITERINKIVENETFVKRGEVYFNDGATTIDSYNENKKGNIEILAKTSGSRIYEQHVSYDKESNEIDEICSCPAFYTYGSCKHLASVYFAAEAEHQFISTIIKNETASIRTGVYCDIVLQLTKKGKNKITIACALNNTETGRLLTIHNILDFVHTYRNSKEEDPYFYVGNGKDTLKKGEFQISEEQEQFMEWFAHNNDGSFGGKSYNEVTLAFEGGDLRRLIEVLEYAKQEDLTVLYRPRTADVYMPIILEQENIDAYFTLEIMEEKFILTMQMEEGNRQLDKPLIVTDECIYFYSIDAIQKIARLMHRYNGSYTIQTNGAFIQQTLYDREIEGIPVDIGEAIIADIFLTIEPSFELHLSKLEGENMEIMLIARYGDILINLYNNRQYNYHKFVKRDKEAEDKVTAFVYKLIPETAMFQHSRHKRNPESQLIIASIEEIFAFIEDVVPKIIASEDPKVTVFLDSALEKMKRVQLTFAVAATSADNAMIDLSLEKNEDVTTADLQKILFEYRLKRRYIELSSGGYLDTFDERNKKQLERLTLFERQLEHFVDKNQASIPQYQLFELVGEKNNKRVVSIDHKLEQMIADLHDLKPKPLAIAEELKSVLREYQLIGVYWMQQLAHFKFGGILADEMGLGKTLQVIAYLTSNPHPNMPTLIVAPKTLMYNWKMEFGKFAPMLQVKVIDGTPRQRQKIIECADKNDILITSYPLIVKDFPHYNVTFGDVILDEAQYIKNPNTKMAKVVKGIPSHQRFALTGTPMENNLMEVWSIFDFLMTGFLGTQRQFIQTTFTPVYKDEDMEAFEALKEKIAPFILRREKSKVLTELPDKIETPMYCEMDNEQASLYHYYLAKAQEEAQQELMQENFESTGKIKILAIITRLRQICTHPAMFLDNYKGESAKLNMLLELLDEALANNHRILLFSQFTSMLAIIEDELQKKDIDYLYLHGQTPSKKRMEMVETFNAPDAKEKIFLLSLKAGGTGLNLTSADIVIHFDPWWNPSVENQATDRAHRFGQEKVVQVFQFITKDTIEERIQELKMKKQKMFNTLFTSEQQAFSKLSKEDIAIMLDLK